MTCQNNSYDEADNTTNNLFQWVTFYALWIFFFALWHERDDNLWLADMTEKDLGTYQAW